MPKSKRDKKISLTQTKKKGLDLKKKLVQDIHDCVDKYAHIFTFSMQNIRNNKLKDVRQEWSQSRFFFGKNKVMSLALGRNRSDEYRPGLRKIARRLQGQTGLLFTNASEQQVLSWFGDFTEAEFSRAGNKATQTVHAVSGAIPAFTHDMEPQLRRLGLPTCLQKGVVTLRQDYKICEKDKPLTPEQAQILKLFGYKMAQFCVTVESMWSSNGKFKIFSGKQVEQKLPSSCVRIKPTDRIARDVICEVIPVEDDEQDDDSVDKEMTVD